MNPDHFADTQWEEVLAEGANQEPSEPPDVGWTTEALWDAYND